MKDEMRLENLRLLVHEHGTQHAAAEKIGIPHTEIIRYLKNKHLSVPDYMARNIEQTLDKPNGWMDRKNYDLKLSESEWELLSKFREMSDKNKKIITTVLNALHTIETGS